ncbi:TAXI family TRAP transporter solute-binding subunit [Amphritea sp. 2_MG-2023]|uniref:TAXI family TRAP transporter solute-binding subunit n=1 Tax=Amphritea TaxID=515417 RepID=UPI001C0673F3|nr:MULTISPECIES: TAXI family TRAP transporter solute-binding subunit [Amphritea]MBU2966748.1 TAXI family TRAP transporter solute-binding subunit [Amphritea atlantica]MDO6418985.1 TAXI family TRAP transporter solute-binding subunit [Amphritea sp. 2_MG-2023]
MKMSILTSALALGVLSAGIATTTVAATKTHVSIGTGGQTGVYYVVGQSICKMVNRTSKEHGLRCSAPSTGGSIANLNSIRDGGLDMGVAQSDWQYHAYNGTSKFEKIGANKSLRAVFSVHAEPFTVVVRADSGIKHFDELEGKRVNIGNPGSGQRGTMEVMMGLKGWDKSSFKLTAELKSSEHSQALCDNKIDAFVHTAGHPVANIKEAASSCDVRIVPVTGDYVDRLVSEHAYYSAAQIPAGMYKGTDIDIDTFGVSATFVSSDQVPSETIYQLVKAVFENFDRFKRLHPAFANLKPEDMIKNGLSAPLHDGAVRYYKERGWM